jgi:hypothetical protein
MLTNFSLRRHLPQWFRSEAADFYLTILAATTIAAELTYWAFHHQLTL